MPVVDSVRICILLSDPVFTVIQHARTARRGKIYSRILCLEGGTRDEHQGAFQDQVPNRHPEYEKQPITQKRTKTLLSGLEHVCTNTPNTPHENPTLFRFVLGEPGSSGCGGTRFDGIMNSDRPGKRDFVPSNRGLVVVETVSRPSDKS